MGESAKTVIDRLIADPDFQKWACWLISTFGSVMARIDEVDDEILRAPQSTLRRLRQETLSGLTPPELGDAQVRHLRSLWAAFQTSDDTVSQLAGILRSWAASFAARSDTASSALLAMATEADACVPYVARLAFTPRPDDFDMRATECSVSLAKAARMNGEERARQVMETFRIMAETIYPRYLMTLLRLSKLRHGDWTKATGSTGNLLGSTPSAVFSEFSQLLERDAAFFRNAAAHQDWEYLDGDKLKIWNEDPPGTMKRGPEEFDVDELFNRAQAMFEHSHRAVDFAATVYGLRICAELLETTLPLWTAIWTGPQRSEALEETASEAKRLLQASEDFAKKHCIVPSARLLSEVTS